MKMRATQNFSYGTKLADSWIHGGMVFDESDPVVKAFPDFFEPVYETVSNPASTPEPAKATPAARRRRDG